MKKPERVWYVAYGSNVNEARFRRYITGDADHHGCRDHTPPAASKWTVAPLQLRFAGESRRWGGGVCFVDPDPSTVAYVRAWDITAEQFEDVFHQENRRAPDDVFDWTAVDADGATMGTSWYARILHVDLPFASATHPALTFTWAKPMPLNDPAPAYYDTIAAGLADHPDLPDPAIRTYLNNANLA